MLLLLLLVVVVLLLVGVLLFSAANRLDRLHVRTDAGWAALDAALARRAVVARAVAASGAAGEYAFDLHGAAVRAESASRAEREVEENELTRMLSKVDRAGLPVALVHELGEAGHRVVIARRVHNDAVRDTLALRRRRSVRYFRLAGTATPPEYFEIAEPQP
ncbi:MAG: NUDIX hydrolase [Pseudonocardiaceae bacterium]